MNPHVSLAALVACLSPLAAQTVSVSLTALTPLTVQVSDATSANQATWPLGSMPDFGSILALLPSGALGFASTDWNSYASDRAAVASITHQVYNPQALTSFSGQAGPDEFLVEFSSATPVTARLQISRWTDLTSGAPWPTIQIDFDNDGAIDVANLSASQGALLLPSFGPQPLQIRVIMTSTLGSQVQSFNRVALVLTPENNLTIATPVAACFSYVPTPPQPPAFLAAAFPGRGVDFVVQQNPFEPTLIVLGFGAQPVLLSTLGSAPCILLPVPDILLFEPSGLRNLPLPASLRPVTFFAQGVVLSQVGLLTTDGFVVTAN